jgi:uncharacterized protein YegP (UPF0339 family)
MAKQSVLRVFEVYQSNRSQQWGWRAKSFKNKKITFTGESHPSEAKAIRAIQQELTALGATNPVRIEVISGLNKRAFIIDTMAPLGSIPPFAALEKAMETKQFKSAMKKADAHMKATPKATKKKLDAATKRVRMLREMGFSSRARNCLLGEGLATERDLLACTEEQLRDIPGLGKGTLKNITDVLDRMGLSLKD